ncbi:uncharacterized protein LOC134213861 [Armigeres subalbatus]|uniref:uncharacterized protein LOC134213861 n=1 Tax=Armigeres subalbatus TaxID=124917 RepID=UPI002ED1E32D
MYYSIISEICKLDKSLMETKLTLARLNPTEFATAITKEQGFTAVVAGEVLHVLKCKPVYVLPRSSNRCYQEIPANYNNESVFIAPVTRVLQKRGTEIDCTPLLPAKFMFGGRWYTTDGKFRETTAPEKLSTEIVTSWTYTSLPNLMKSGVYDEDSVRKMKNMIYEQGDRRIASSVIHRILTNQNPNHQGFRFEALIAEHMVEGIVSQYWEKFLTWSHWFGHLSSTVLGAYLILRILKFIIDTLIHGRILYDIYGFGWQLIASLWDSFTNFLSHRHATRRPTAQDFDVEQPALVSPTAPLSAPLDQIRDVEAETPFKPTYPIINNLNNH